jgi:hypothetical protein
MLAMTAVTCAPKHLVLPSGHGTPTTEFQGPFEQASTGCRAVRTIRTSIRLSGRAGSERMRGTLIAGFERPDAMRLEGVAPFGPPVFILAARDGSATLLLPRDNRVLTGVSAAEILEALAGVRLDPASLRAILSGCVAADPHPVAGRVFTTDGPITIGQGTTGYPRQAWLVIDLDPDTTAYLRQQQGQWRIVAGRLPGLEVQYDQFESGLPRQILIRSSADEPPAVPVDLSLALLDVSINVTLNPAAFTVNVPADAVSMTLAEVRDAGPLGIKGK